MEKVISICIPCMNRTYDLKKVMPSLIKMANTSPPVEIVILDYNSQDDLAEYIESVKEKRLLLNGSTLLYVKCAGRGHYHMAHARNLSVLVSSGEYIVISSADIFLDENFINIVRGLIDTHNFVWMCGEKHKAVIVCQKKEFVDAGGYDERFEFYGGEDRDLYTRLQKRGKRFGMYPARLVKVIHTPGEIKVKNYRLKLSKHEMIKRGRAIYSENLANDVLVANKGKKWGQDDGK